MAVPNMWRTKKQRYRLQAEVCLSCSKAVFPPREVCPHCHQPMQAKGAVEPALSLTMWLKQPPLAVPIPAGSD